LLSIMFKVKLLLLQPAYPASCCEKFGRQNLSMTYWNAYWPFACVT